MAKTKTKQKSPASAGFLTAIICFIIAAVLILGAAGMGMINLNFGDMFYENVNVSEMLQDNPFTIIRTNMPASSLIIGITVFIAVSFIFCIFLKLADKDRNIIKTAITFTLSAFILRCMAALLWTPPQGSDFKSVYDLSYLISTIPIGYWGRFIHELGTQYTGVWSAHMPFILYQALILRAEINPALLNAAYGTAMCLFTALSAKELFGKKAFSTALMFTAFNPLLILFTSTLSNQHPSAMLFTAALWLILKYKNIRGAVLGAAVLAAAQIMRPEMTAAAIGIIVYYMFLKAKTKDKKQFTNALVFALVFVLLIIIFDAAMRGGGLISGHIFNGNLKYKICIGLNSETGGGWNEADGLLINDPEALNSVFWERLFRTENAALMFNKVIYQFGSFVYPWILDTAGHPLFSNIICRRGVSAYMMIIAVTAAVRLIRDKENRARLFPVFIIIFVYMLVYSVTEIQPRYNFTVIPLLTILAADIEIKK